jgi:Tol biopolymer transport system component
MSRATRISLACIVATAMVYTAQPVAQQSGDVALRAAVETETIKGDLAGAIEQYRALAEGDDRAVAAQALLRMAQSYEKLGDAQARTIYERVVRDFADQADAVTIARTHLADRTSPPKVAGERAVLTGPNVNGYGTVTPDGRFLTYVDFGTRQVTLRDLRTGVDRPLTAGVRGRISRDADPLTAISRDGKQVAFEWAPSKEGEWLTPDDGRVELRVAKVEGIGVPESRTLLSLTLDVAEAISPLDWSPDGKLLLVNIQRTDLVGQLSLVSVEDGSYRVLKSVAWSGPHRAFFLPDGRSITYSVDAEDTLDETRIFVMSVDGSRERIVVDHPSRNIIMGWSPDGGSLLFASDRSGAFGLWAIPVADGQSEATATLLKANIGSSWSLGVTTAGALYVWRATVARHLQVSPIDVDLGSPSTGPAQAFQVFLGHGGNPVWSPDGKFLAYMSGAADEHFTGNTFTIHSTDGTIVRRLPRRLSYLQRFAWALDGRAIIGRGRDLKGRWGTYRVDVETGEPTRVGEGEELWPSESPEHRTMAAITSLDGTKHFLRSEESPYQPGGRIIERDLLSGAERVLYEGTSPGVGPFLSPDGRQLAFGQGQATNGNNLAVMGNGNILLVMPASGGPPREVFRGFRRMVWTSDSRALVVLKAPPNRQELWLVPIDGSPPRNLGIQVHDGSGQIPYSLRPDGKQIAFVAGDAAPSRSEVWAIENVLPPMSRAGR